MKPHLKPYGDRRNLQQPARHGLGEIVVFFWALTVFATGGEPIAPGELVAPKLEIVGGEPEFHVPAVGRGPQLPAPVCRQVAGWNVAGSCERRHWGWEQPCDQH